MGFCENMLNGKTPLSHKAKKERSPKQFTWSWKIHPKIRCIYKYNIYILLYSMYWYIMWDHKSQNCLKHHQAKIGEVIETTGPGCTKVLCKLGAASHQALKSSSPALGHRIDAWAGGSWGFTYTTCVC